MLNHVWCRSLALILLATAPSFAGDLDNINKPGETDGQVPTPTPTPTPVPTPNPTPTPTPTPTPESKVDAGFMTFGARVVSNMENGFHIMDHGYKAVCVDSKGVVAKARMDIYAAINGEVPSNVPGNGYAPITLRPTIEYLRSGATSGSCDFKVCLAKEGSSESQEITCDPRALQGAAGGSPDAERPVELKESGVAYSVSGKDISLKTKYQLVSGFHPVFGFAAPEKAFKDYQSPLVIDMAGKGQLDLVDVWNTKHEIRFDLIADGAAVRTGWTGKNSGFLALDRNGNGKIDNGLELFGEYTEGAKVRDDGKRWDNGFLALAQYDTNKDGAIDSKDAVFSKLVVWTDKNLDGKSKSSELVSLQKAGITSINLGYSENLSEGKFVKVEGNEVRLISTVSMKDGSKKQIADVWFRQRRFADRPVASSDFSK